MVRRPCSVLGALEPETSFGLLARAIHTKRCAVDIRLGHDSANNSPQRRPLAKSTATIE